MSRAEKLLEGFKLGDLGAGKTHFAGEVTPRRNVNGTLEVIKAVRPDDEHPYVKWADTDQLIYVLACDQVSEKKWKVHISCQKSRVASDPDDELWVISTEALTEKQARKLYARGFGMVVPEGIYAMIKEGYLSSFYVTRSKDAYSKWSRIKSQELANAND